MCFSFMHYITRICYIFIYVVYILMCMCARVSMTDYVYIVVYQLCTCAKNDRLLYVKFELLYTFYDASIIVGIIPCVGS